MKSTFKSTFKSKLLAQFKFSFKDFRFILFFGILTLSLSLLTIDLPGKLDIKSNLVEMGIISCLPYMPTFFAAFIVSLFTGFNLSEFAVVYPDPLLHVIGMVYMYFAYKWASKLRLTKEIILSWIAIITTYYFVILIPLLLFLHLIRGDFVISEFLGLYISTAFQIIYEWIFTTTLSIMYFLMLNNYNAMKRIVYVDTATGLPNGLQMELDLNELSRGSQNTSNLALIGIRLMDYEHIAQLEGLEHANELFAAVSKQIYEVQREWLTISNSGFLYYPLSNFCYRLNESTLLFLVHLDGDIDLCKEDIKTKCTKIMKQFSSHIRNAKGGMTVYPQDATSVQQLTKNVLNLLYSNTPGVFKDFEFFNPAEFKKFLREEKLRNSIELALKNDEFYYVFQPKVDSNNSKIIGFEALARWSHPDLGAISPVEFIPIAEKYNFIEQITTKLLGSAYKFIDKLRVNGGENCRVSINLSAKLITMNYLNFLFSEFNQRNMLKSLELEITESMISDLSPDLVLKFIEFNRSGLSLAIDDFGTGYSNLNYLQALNANVLKIDKSFVDGILTNSEKPLLLIKAISNIASSLGMTLVAEGVEVYSQIEFLQKAGCNIIQGYYYSKPLEFNDAVDYFENSKQYLTVISSERQ